MDKEELLKKAQAENKGEDVAEKEIDKISGDLALTALVFLIDALIITEYVLGGSFNYSYLGIILFSATARNLIKGIKIKSIGRIVICSIGVATSLALIICWYCFGYGC